MACGTLRAAYRRPVLFHRVSFIWISMHMRRDVVETDGIIPNTTGLELGTRNYARHQIRLAFLYLGQSAYSRHSRNAKSGALPSRHNLRTIHQYRKVAGIMDSLLRAPVKNPQAASWLVVPAYTTANVHFLRPIRQPINFTSVVATPRRRNQHARL